MKISLITVCYNSAATIRDTMESVALQEVEKIGGGGVEVEYIVVDGGSTDGTVEEIKKFELRIKNEVEKVGGGGQRNFSFKWLSERDRGMYDALNKGIAMATGDVIGILNADDVLAEDDTLAKVAAAFGDPEIDGIYADIRFVRDAGWRGDEIFGKIRSAKTARMRYLPLCTTVMRMGGASTNGWRTTLKINRADLRALKAYFFKVWGFVFKTSRHSACFMI